MQKEGVSVRYIAIGFSLFKLSFFLGEIISVVWRSVFIPGQFGSLEALNLRDLLLRDTHSSSEFGYGWLGLRYFARLVFYPVW